MKRIQLSILATFFNFLTCSFFTSCSPINPPEQKPADAMHKSAKRGVSFNFTKAMDLPLLSPSISWDYNWGNTTNDLSATWFDANNVEFCPMCWNGNYNKEQIRAFVAAHPNTKYLLAFNEPNLTDQANMIPSKAAELWDDVKALAQELNLKLVSPAMNYGTLAGYSDPIKWLDEFFAQPNVSLDDIDAIAIHCYMSSPSAVQGYVERFAKYNKPIWMTEFCAWDPAPSSYETQMAYMCNVLNYFEASPLIERYAWFMPRMSGKVESVPYNQLLTHGETPELTDLGKLFTLFSSFDKSVYLNANKYVYAHEYIELSDNAVQVRPSTDTEAQTISGREGLQVNNFNTGRSITYQIATTKANTLELRHTGYANSELFAILDGNVITTIQLPRTGSSTAWQATTVPVDIKAGNHTFTLTVTSGSFDFSGFRLYE